MTKLSASDKRLVVEKLDGWIVDGGDKYISQKSYYRARKWAFDNYSLSEIADIEGVSHQTVSVSVRDVVAKIKENMKD